MIWQELYENGVDCNQMLTIRVDTPKECVAKDNMDSATICWKLKWYCHDPAAQVSFKKGELY